MLNLNVLLGSRRAKSYDDYADDVLDKVADKNATPLAETAKEGKFIHL